VLRAALLDSKVAGRFALILGDRPILYCFVRFEYSSESESLYLLEAGAPRDPGSAELVKIRFQAAVTGSGVSFQEVEEE
jgi:hypothetical protein